MYAKPNTASFAFQFDHCTIASAPQICDHTRFGNSFLSCSAYHSDALLHLRGDDFTPLVFPVRTLGLCFTFRVYLIKSLAPFYAVRGHQSALDAIAVSIFH